jgi:hypothetical protein
MLRELDRALAEAQLSGCVRQPGRKVVTSRLTTLPTCHATISHFLSFLYHNDTSGNARQISRG